MKKLLLLLLFAVVATSCVMSNDTEQPVRRVFVMYDNIGDPYFSNDVEEARSAVKAGLMGYDGRVIVFHRKAAGSEIYEISRLGTRTIKKYEPGVNATLSLNVLSSVLTDIRAQYPSASNWGLAFGSHGMGWMPSDATAPSRADAEAGGGEASGFEELWRPHGEGDKTRYFADSGDVRMDVGPFADVVDDWKWDFLILDDCFMGSIEAIYRMRAAATWIIASPTEIMIDGFPYDRVVKTIFKDWTDMKGVGQEFIDYYGSRNPQLEPPCGTIVVVRTNQIDLLAKRVKDLKLTTQTMITSTEGIQFYEGFSSPGHIFYDLKGYLMKIRTPVQLIDFADQLSRVVIYAGHTPTFFTSFGDREIAINSEQFSGLSTFVPTAELLPIMPLYRATDWFKATYVE